MVQVGKCTTVSQIRRDVVLLTMGRQKLYFEYSLISHKTLGATIVTCQSFKFSISTKIRVTNNGAHNIY